MIIADAAEGLTSRPATAVTVADLRAHSARHARLAYQTEGRYRLAHRQAAEGLLAAAVAHEALDRLDTERGYR